MKKADKNRAPKAYKTSISIPRDLHRAGTKKAHDKKWAFSTYVQDLIEKDLQLKEAA